MTGNGTGVSRGPLVELRDVRASYGRIEVLHGVDLAVPAGQVVALLGPNGAGKTTVLLTITRLIEPLGGSITIAGTPSKRTNTAGQSSMRASAPAGSATNQIAWNSACASA